MDLTKDQSYVFTEVMDKIGSSKEFYPKFKYLTVGGFAGTGKTFLISIIRQEIYNRYNKKDIAFVTFTGKASSVLKTKLDENNAFFEADFCGTIHSLIYKPELHYDKNSHKMVITGWFKKEELAYDLIFLDEASMVNQEIWNDLISYNIPIVAVGDNGQLPPIGDKFNLMKKPEYILSEIKRQALDNPIIRLSQDIRNGKSIPDGFYDSENKNVFKLPWSDPVCRKIFNNIDFFNEDVILLCGFNRTRVSFNQMIRTNNNFNSPEPYPGERVVFLKNNYFSKVLNGMLGKVLYLMYESNDIYNMTINIDDYEDPYSGLVYNKCFGKEKYDEAQSEIQEIKNTKFFKNLLKNSDFKTLDLCDFGYCISVHKSQGSEFKKVVCYIERSSFWDDEYMRKWLYTAVTRAKEKLFLIV